VPEIAVNEELTGLLLAVFTITRVPGGHLPASVSGT
jgi:hypothetical protein